MEKHLGGDTRFTDMDGEKDDGAAKGGRGGQCVRYNTSSAAVCPHPVVDKAPYRGLCMGYSPGQQSWLGLPLQQDFRFQTPESDTLRADPGLILALAHSRHTPRLMQVQKQNLSPNRKAAADQAEVGIEVKVSWTLPRIKGETYKLPRLQKIPETDDAAAGERLVVLSRVVQRRPQQMLGWVSGE